MPLSDLGFTSDEERVYRALLAESWTDLETLSRRTSVDVEALRAALDSLSDHGVITIDAGGVTVHDPHLVIGSLIEHLEDQLMTQYRRVSAMRSEVFALHRSESAISESLGLDIERLEGLDAVRSRIAELSFFARTSVKAIHPGGPQSGESLEASRPLDRRAARRGMRIQVLHESSALADEANRAYLHELVNLGVQVKVADRLAERIVILDDQVAIVPIDPHDTRRGALVVRHPGLVMGLLDLFERTWQSAYDPPWASDSHSESVDMDEQDRRLLGMLAAGCTDEVAAREFGLSVRHLRRRIARLMSELGARSRFEAGVEAARRGWL